MMTLDARKKLLVLFIIVCLPFFVAFSMTASCMGGCGAPKQSSGPFITHFSKREWRNNTMKTILLWTPNFGNPWWGQEKRNPFGKCPHKCQLTINKDELDGADALLFHSRSLWNNFLGYTMPSHHPPHQIWILNACEPPPHVFLNMKSFNNVFNWTFWYRTDADIPSVYGKMVRIDNESISWATELDLRLKAARKGFKLKNPNPSRSRLLTDKPNQAPDHNNRKAKDKFLSWTSSNCIDQGRRQRVVKQLQKYLQVDTYGDCGETDLPCPEDYFRCVKHLSPYRFALAFENSVCRDYVTEKFWLPLERGQIPIVYGGAVYSSFVPTNSYIDVKDFEDIESLAEYIKKVDSDEDLYNSYFWWKNYYKISVSPESWCDICKALHDKTKHAQVYSDLDGWYRNDICQQFSVTDIVSRFVEGMLLKNNLIS